LRNTCNICLLAVCHRCILSWMIAILHNNWWHLYITDVWQHDFWATVTSNGSPCAMGPLSVLSVCNVGVLWPNGWMDQDATWHTGRPQPTRHCVRWDSASPQKGAQQPPPHFSAHVYCGNEAGWIRMLFGTEVGLGPGGIVLDGHPTVPSPTFWPMSIVAKWSPVSATAEHLLVNVCGHCCFQFLFH